MNRTELIDAVAASAELTRKDASAALDSILSEITAAVRSGDAVQITGFGSFKPRNRAAGTARNPRTGETIKTKASKGIGFSAGATLKADLNSKGKLKKS